MPFSSSPLWMLLAKPLKWLAIILSVLTVVLVATGTFGAVWEWLWPLLAFAALWLVAKLLAARRRYPVLPPTTGGRDG